MATDLRVRTFGALRGPGPGPNLVICIELHETVAHNGGADQHQQG